MVERIGQYWGFFDWLIWALWSLTRVILWFGKEPIDVWDVFTNSYFVPSATLAKTLDVAACYGLSPAEGSLPSVNHVILLEPCEQPAAHTDPSAVAKVICRAPVGQDMAALSDFYMELGFGVVETALTGD